ncbi:MAG: cellulase family glycosylhydrolase, partial [Burkholderiales bacterium]|nr:cellulase family glycosylhydrolase [Opitutaceae bacterium]
PAAPAPLTPLRVEGLDIRADRGRGPVVRLHGVNLGGWLLQESFMSPLQPGWDEHRARATLTERFGPARAQKLVNAFQDAWITDADFARIAASGLNCVRLPIHWQNHVRADGSFDFSRIDWTIRHAARHGLYTLLDLHGAPGSQNGRDHSGDQRGPLLWDSPENRDLTKRLWRALAERYRGDPAVAGYDLLNEPARTAKAKQWDQTIIDFVSELYAEVRAADPDHIVFFSVWSEYKHVGDLTVGKENYVLAYHWYVYKRFLENEGSEADFWRQRITEFASASRELYPAPVFIGEFSFKDDPALWSERLAFMTSHDLHWAKWSYKTRAGTGWGLYEANKENDANIPDLAHDDYATILRKWSSWTTEHPSFVRNESVHAAFLQSAALVRSDQVRGAHASRVFWSASRRPVRK